MSHDADRLYALHHIPAVSGSPYTVYIGEAEAAIFRTEVFRTGGMMLRNPDGWVFHGSHGRLTLSQFSGAV